MTDDDRRYLVCAHLAACLRAHRVGASYTLTPAHVERALALGVPVPPDLTASDVVPWWRQPSRSTVGAA